MEPLNYAAPHVGRKPASRVGFILLTVFNGIDFAIAAGVLVCGVQSIDIFSFIGGVLVGAPLIVIHFLAVFIPTFVYAINHPELRRKRWMLVGLSTLTLLMAFGGLLGVSMAPHSRSGL